MSGLKGDICEAGVPTNCVPKATFGGLGSALMYTGHDNVLIPAPDCGPFDGLTDVPDFDRVHVLYLAVDQAKSFPNIKAVLLDTQIYAFAISNLVVQPSRLPGPMFPPGQVKKILGKR